MTYKFLPIELGVYELVLWLIYIAIGAVLVFLYKSFNDTKNLPFLMPAYFTKIIGGFLFAMVYLFYYHGEGDTIEYFKGSKQLADFFWERPSLYFELMKADYLEAQQILANEHEFIRFSLSDEEWFMIKLISPLNMLGLQSYLGLTFFMSFIAFFGSYKLFQVMNEIIGSKYQNIIFIINFCIPSVLFWGSGVLKDTVTLASFSFLVYIFYKVIIKENYKLKFFIAIIIFSYILFSLKAYILFCLLIWFFLTFFLVLTNKSSNPIVKFLFLPYLIFMFFGISYLSLNFLLESSSDYQQDMLLKKIEGFQLYHATLGGSYYSLGDVEYTQIGLIKKLPQAINVTLFRPYPWEANTALVFINSIESMFLFSYLILVLFKYKLSLFKNIKSNPFLIGALVFCLVFSFTIGLTSYNFGALSRFKIPIVALFFFILYYIYIQKKENYINGLK